ncbi:MAG TPA: hypothetical protein IAA51_12960 [Candidatus Cottocaccamicrobium excrementipullorum]|nr:hypothetical protein [Candidatus Cottocaccamicrobium excrementipullorum]
MSLFLSFTGAVTAVSPVSSSSASGPEPCQAIYSLFSPSGPAEFRTDAGTYVLESQAPSLGDQTTVFTPANAPVPLIYPPRYYASAMAKLPEGSQAALDRFDSSLMSSDGSLRLNLTPETRIIMPNGLVYFGSLSGKLMMAVYTRSTRSIPAVISPDILVVFCEDTSAE